MNDRILLETSVFEKLGGWTIDTQCVEAMGAPYLLAHGIGKPVADAVTTFRTGPKGMLSGIGIRP